MVAVRRNRRFLIGGAAAAAAASIALGWIVPAAHDWLEAAALLLALAAAALALLRARQVQPLPSEAAAPELTPELHQTPVMGAFI